MAMKSKIEWTENTWNPVTGCTRISSGCKNCYAATMAKRLMLMGNPKYKNGFQLTLHENCLGEDPLLGLIGLADNDPDDGAIKHDQYIHFRPSFPSNR